MWWTTEVNIAFSRLEEGYETAMKDYYKKQVNQLITLINLLLGDLSKANRQRIMTICTIDVHARDVVAKLVAQKVDNAQAFLWLSQLRHRCVIAIFRSSACLVLLCRGVHIQPQPDLVVNLSSAGHIVYVPACIIRCGNKFVRS